MNDDTGVEEPSAKTNDGINKVKAVLSEHNFTVLPQSPLTELATDRAFFPQRKSAQAELEADKDHLSLVNDKPLRELVEKKNPCWRAIG
jgi:hypothetical protein